MEKQTYDAVVSDYEMPLKNGLEFLRELREQKRDIPFILFTGKGREEVVVEALNLGADRYINKNGSPETVYCELADAINKTVERKKSRKALVESELKYRTVVEKSLQGILITQTSPLRLVFGKALKATKRRMKILVADSQYSSRNLRDLVSDSRVRVVIPFPANQQRDQKGLLRVDKYFRTHGPSVEKQIYKSRSSIERVNSRLKDQLCLERHRVKGLWRIAIHALFCLIAMLLNAVAALRLHKTEKARSITLLAK
jgi:CheY-like chemotaxis protein